MQVFYIIVDPRDVPKLSKLTESHEWQLHSKHAKIFNKIKNNDLILFSKESNYSWDAILELKEKHTLEIKNNSDSEFREKNKTLLLEFKNKNLLSKYQNSFDVPNLSKLKPGVYFLKNILSAKKLKEVKHKNPEKIFSVAKRVKRDAQKVMDLKLRYLDKCQICNYCLVLENGKRHSEVHHLRPIGNEGGNDDTDNMVVLCPNHHKAFDFSVLRLDLNGNNVIALDEKEIAQIKFKRKHKLSKENITYQYYRRSV
ncbi:MAG: hypothetical protein CXT78_04330 [Thaumarchaeota archaeon]|jgi:hypothetical protein|nr:MAG: hypothetical protein CXT78_04330 [Nitrososphaerota archaeon]